MPQIFGAFYGLQINTGRNTARIHTGSSKGIPFCQRNIKSGGGALNADSYPAGPPPITTTFGFTLSPPDTKSIIRHNLLDILYYITVTITFHMPACKAFYNLW